MKRLPSLVYLAFLLILVSAAVSPAAAEPAANATVTVTASAATTAAATTPEKSGGSVFFETDPSGATIWVDGKKIGTSDTTYYSEKTGALNIVLQRKDYENYTGSVTVAEGRRVEFYAKLVPIPLGVPATEPTLPPTVVMVTTIRKSTLTIPTSWPTTTQSPVGPAAVALGTAAGLGILAARRR